MVYMSTNPIDIDSYLSIYQEWHSRAAGSKRVCVVESRRIEPGRISSRVEGNAKNRGGRVELFGCIARAATRNERKCWHAAGQVACLTFSLEAPWPHKCRDACRF